MDRVELIQYGSHPKPQRRLVWWGREKDRWADDVIPSFGGVAGVGTWVSWWAGPKPRCGCREKLIARTLGERGAHLVQSVGMLIHETHVLLQRNTENLVGRLVGQLPGWNRGQMYRIQWQARFL